MNSSELAQWVINNRYPKSEKEKVSDVEMYNYIIENLKQQQSNGWISVEDRLPDSNKDGNKVLLYRIMNDTQETMPITVHDSKMVKHCIPQETWWQPLPPPPKN